MIDALIRLATVAIGYLDTKLKQKYIDKVENLKRQLYEELGKVGEDRNNAAIDNLEFELRITVDSLIASLEHADT